MEPLGQPPVFNSLDAWEQQIGGSGHMPIHDPLWPVLDGPEASIEQMVPPKPGMHDGGPHRMLDTLEASVEGQQPPGSGFVHDPLHHLLDTLEKQIEGTVIKPPPKPEDPPEPPMEENYDSYEREPPFQYTGQIPFTRQYSPPVHARGSRTGIRNAGVRSEYYCYLFECPVSLADCFFCSDFEHAETQTNEGEEYCQHSALYLESM